MASHARHDDASERFAEAVVETIRQPHLVLATPTEVDGFEIRHPFDPEKP